MTMTKTKRGYMYNILLLASLGAYVFDTVREGVQLEANVKAKRGNLRKRQLMNERFLAVTQSTWPLCVEFNMNAEDCKDFIDEIIYNNFTDKDKYIRSVIMGKRRKTDKLYNAVSILMNDNDMVEGRDGDGMVYSDFTWDGTGDLATVEQQSEIPPITAMEPAASLSPIGIEPETLPATVAPVTTETETETDDTVLEVEEPPIVVFDEVITGVTGSTVDEFLAASSEGGTATAPLAGGVVTDSSAVNTPEGEAKIEDALATLPPGGESGESAGERTIEPIDCTGLTGENCCLLVKLKVRDSDLNGKAIQCTLNYVETSTKKQYWKNLRGKKVHIFANHNGKVSKIPQIVGGWPKGMEGEEFVTWLSEAGSPPKIMQVE